MISTKFHVWFFYSWQYCIICKFCVYSLIYGYIRDVYAFKFSVFAIVYEMNTYNCESFAVFFKKFLAFFFFLYFCYKYSLIGLSYQHIWRSHVVFKSDQMLLYLFSINSMRSNRIKVRKKDVQRFVCETFLETKDFINTDY